MPPGSPWKNWRPDAGARSGAAPPPPRTRPAAAPALPASEFSGAAARLERCYQELARYYRYSACGRLCRGLVHRMNTPLQVLFFQVELLEQKSGEEQEVLAALRHPVSDRLQTLHRYRAQKLRQLHQELANLQELTRSLMRHEAHEDAEEPVTLDLNEVYRLELDLYQSHPLFKRGVESNFSFQAGLPLLRGHYLDFSQSFRNLLENALEAMEGADRRRLTVVTTLEDGRRLLYLGDTGTGIPPEAAPHLFEPFFTTKQNGAHGHAGLGLFMAKRLLAPYGGEIRLHSVPGETWVTVALPV